MARDIAGRVNAEVVATDAREMACDNRHMAISPRGESA